jgi:putative ABC transport system permease protein
MDRSTLRIALRTLSRHRGFTAVAVLSLAIAIALNTTMYSAMIALVDPPIPVREPDKIYTLRFFGDLRKQLHATAVEDALREGMQGFQAVTGAREFFFEHQSLAEANGRFARVQQRVVLWNFFDFLGTPALAGRTFTQRDEGSNNIVISERLAGLLFADQSAIGQSVDLGGSGYIVIGVVQRTPAITLLNCDVWLLRTSSMAPVPITHIRFRERIDKHDINDRLKVVANRLAMAVGEAPGSTAFRGLETVYRPMRLYGLHFGLIGAVVAILLVACANLANLQLARGLARSRELALRAAVGATRRQLIAHLVLETGLLAFAGMVLGVVLTLWGIHLVKSMIPPVMFGFLMAPEVTWGMFGFAAIAGLACLFLVGLLPSIWVSRVDPETLLKSGTGTGANRAHRKRYGLMVIAQIGFSLPVLIGAILLIKTGLRNHSREFQTKELYGYDPTPIVVANVPISLPPTARSVALGDIASRMLSLARTVPGVVEAGVEFNGAVDGPNPKMVVVDDENGVLREESAVAWSFNIVTPSYLRVFGHDMAQGRNFSETEFDGDAVIMDARTAKFLWGNHPPLRRAIKFGGNRTRQPFHRVVGIVGDKRDTFAIRRRDPNANYRLNLIYRVVKPTDSIAISESVRLRAVVRGMPVPPRYVALSVRVQGNTELAALRLQRALRAVAAPGYEPSALPQVEALGITARQILGDFSASLFATFALIGLGLVAIGVYGIVAHSVEERRREIAVRISLGATTRNILHAVLREGNVLILSGVAMGLLLSKYGVWFLPIPETFGYDATLFAFIAAMLFGLAALAAYVPAFRAARIDPVEALRHE